MRTINEYGKNAAAKNSPRCTRKISGRGPNLFRGRGSDLGQTAGVRETLPALLKELGVKTLLDAPCGDLHWIKTVELGVDYIGVDIVPDLVERLRKDFPGRRFECRDLVEEELPHADLIFCRDCLVHLPLEEVGKVLKNFGRSGAKWLLTTTFPAVTSNGDVKWSGWRALNLQLAPFNLPEPMRLINEGCTEDGGKFAGIREFGVVAGAGLIF